MEEPGRLTEVQRSEGAARVVEQVPKGALAHYALLVRGLPVLLRQHGLGQTLAYLQSRGAERAQSPYLMLYGHLNSWLAEVFGEQRGDFLAALGRSDSRRYLRAAEEAHAFALALRKAVEDMLVPKPEEEVGR